MKLVLAEKPSVAQSIAKVLGAAKREDCYMEVIELDCGGTAFSAKGKTVLNDGWKALVKKNSSTKLDEKEQALPSVSEGDTLTVIGTKIKEGKTSPPKHFTEDESRQTHFQRR